jgi:uncharacterized protein
MQSGKVSLKMLLAAGLCSALLAEVAVAAGPSCSGRDMLAEMREREPAVHAGLAKAAAAVVNTEAMLWKVEKANIAPSYLMGTVHVSDERVTQWSPRVTAALASAKSMAFEVADLSPAAMAAAVGKSLPMFIYTDGRQLDRVLSPDQFSKAAASLAKAGLPAEVATRVKPWFVFMLLAVSDCERGRQAAGKPPLDALLQNEAQKRGIPLVGLETLEGQLAILAAIPEPQQVAMLKATLHFADRTADQMETMLQLYLKRQLGFTIPFQYALAAKAGVDPSAFQSFERDLIDKRNLKMAETARPLLDKGAAFVAVGGMHLVGATGLVAQLRQAGFTVTAVE